MAALPRWNSASAAASTSSGLHSSSTRQAADLVRRRRSSAGRAPRDRRSPRAGIISTETIDSTPNSAASRTPRESRTSSRAAREARADHVAGVIEGLVAAVLPVEAGLPDDAERHAGHGGPDRGAGDRRCDLRGARPTQNSCDSRMMAEASDRADAGDDDVGALVRRGIDQRAGRRRHDHAGDAADRHDRADPAALPAMREQEHAEERPMPACMSAMKKLSASRGRLA